MPDTNALTQPGNRKPTVIRKSRAGQRTAKPVEPALALIYLQSWDDRDAIEGRRVLSFDLALVSSGWAVMDCANNQTKAVAFGRMITSGEVRLSRRLQQLNEAVTRLILEHQPQVVVLEDQFSGPNQKTLINLARVMGAVLAACGKAGIESFLMNAPQWKLTVCGHGRASKEVVMAEINRQYDLNLTSNDVTDAIAIALAFHLKPSKGRLV